MHSITRSSTFGAWLIGLLTVFFILSSFTGRPFYGVFSVVSGFY
jgi:hypothetical protein